MRTALASLLPLALLLGACATAPVVVPAAAGRPAHEVTKLTAASEASFFPCAFGRIVGADGASLDVGRWPQEVTVPSGRYRITLYCTNGAGHTVEPATDLDAKGGKRYKVAGFFIDDSITVFNMRMRARVTELQ